MAAINIRHKLVTVIVILWRTRRRRQKTKAKSKSKFWISPLNVERSLLGAYNSTALLAKENDCFKFFKYTRMSPEWFDHLLSLIRPKIKNKYKVRPPISAEERLAAALRYLASGDSRQSISYQYKMGKYYKRNYWWGMWWESLVDFVKTPSIPQDWENIIKDFDEIWNMPHCLGTIDSKHIAMRQPKHSGSLWHNYWGFFSLVLLAICDARYLF